MLPGVSPAETSRRTKHPDRRLMSSRAIVTRSQPASIELAAQIQSHFALVYILAPHAPSHPHILRSPSSCDAVPPVFPALHLWPPVRALAPSHGTCPAPATKTQSFPQSNKPRINKAGGPSPLLIPRALGLPDLSCEPHRSIFSMAPARTSRRLVCSSLIPFDRIAYHPPTVLCLISSSVAGSPTALRKPGPVSLHRTVLAPTSLNVACPTDSFLHFPTASHATGQSFLVTESSLPDSPTLARGPSLRTVASRSTSSTLSITSETRRMNRLTALACLEGRGHFSTRIPRKNLANFMSMSDDEDEDYPLSQSRRPSVDQEAGRRLSVVTVSNIPSSEIEPSPPSPQQSKMASVRSRHRSRTMESWFPPLANFIDLRNEEDTPKWRSFIEFSPAPA